MKKFIVVIIISLLAITFYVTKENNKKNKEFNPTEKNEDVKKEKAAAQSFIILGDTGSGNSNQYNVAQAVGKYCFDNSCTAVFIAGDVIYDKGVSSLQDPQFKTKFEDPYQNLSFSFYIAFGNHDYLGCQECYIQYSTLSSKWKMPSRFYNQQFENIEFFIINTENFDLKQRQWLQQSLEASSKKWKIVLGHRPINTFESTHTGENWSGREKLKAAICTAADLYISGHAHLLEDGGSIDECKAQQLVSGGGGAEARTILKPNKNKFFYEDNGFLTLAVDQNKLIYNFYDIYTRILFAGLLEK